MEKDLLKRILKNAGFIVLLLVVGIGGVILSQSSGFEVTKQYGQTIYPGSDFLVFAIPALCGLGGLYLIYQEIKLFFQLFVKGGKKTKIGCIFSVVIALFLFLVSSALVFGSKPSRPSAPTDMDTITKTMNEYFYAIQQHDYQTMDSLLLPGALMGTDDTEIALLKSWCQSPVYVSLNEVDMTTGPDPFVDVNVQCQGESGGRKYNLMKNGSGASVTWTIMSVSK